MAAVSQAPVCDNHAQAESDYGSDFSPEEENIVMQLLDDLNNTKKIHTETALDDQISDSTLSKQPDICHVLVHKPEPPRDIASASRGARTHASINTRGSSNAIEEAVRLRSSSLGGINYPNFQGDSAPPTAPSLVGDSRSPIERFRSFPKKPLTVTDISSGAWCELQYWYTLTLLPYGKKAPTPAMRGGTKVHKTLEDQVHTTVEVSIASKEEAFALRLWNVIQGLRTLRDTGLTRELDVWGVVDGHVINGVIDEASYTSPDVVSKEETNQIQSSPEEQADSVLKQPTITDFLEPHRRRVYLTDVKTRGVNSLPNSVAIRPGKVQLFLYHRLLREMASGQVDFFKILGRYGLKPDVRFSDAFMAQIGTLHEEVFQETQSSQGSVGGRYPDSSPNLDPQMSPPPDLIRYRSIQQIIPLLQSELRDTFPQGAASVGNVVCIQYRHRVDGHIIGNQTFPVDTAALNVYLQRNLSWWVGQRQAEGVPIEEAYKCGYCEFAETCTWRQDRQDEFLRTSNK